MNNVQWAPRVAQRKVLQLYETDARGIRDETLIDDVGYGLLARCNSIRVVTDAYSGRIECPRCSVLVLEDGIGSSRDKDQLIRCAECDWNTTWGAYFQTFQGKQLRGRNFEPDLDHFLQHFPKARTPAEKMLLIDRLIHAVHKGTAKPAAVNLLSGKAGQLAVFLDDLAYSEASTSGLDETKARWDGKLRGSSHWGRKLKGSQENPAKT